MGLGWRSAPLLGLALLLLANTAQGHNYDFSKTLRTGANHTALDDYMALKVPEPATQLND